MIMAGMNETPSGERVHIGFFGRRNAGKSSVVNLSLDMAKWPMVFNVVGNSMLVSLFDSIAPSPMLVSAGGNVMLARLGQFRN